MAQHSQLSHVSTPGRAVPAAAIVSTGKGRDRFLAEVLANETSPSHQFSFDGKALDDIGHVLGSVRGAAKYSTISVEGTKSLHLTCCDGVVVLNELDLKNAFSYYTISLWFRAEETAGMRYLYEEGGSTAGIAVRVNDTILEAAVIDGGGGQVNVKVASAGPITSDRWYHVVAVFDRGELRIALDGLVIDVVDTGYEEISIHNDAASIGAPGLTDYQSSINFVGFIDDLRIWDGSALNEDQIYDLFYEFLESPGLSITHQWTFNDDLIDAIGGVVGKSEGLASFSPISVDGRKSLQLSCCNASVLLENETIQKSSTKYTISLWFRAETVGGYRYLYEEGASKTGLAIRLNDNILEAAVVEDGGGLGNMELVSAGPIKQGLWHHAAAVYSRGKLSIALDGKKMDSIRTGFRKLSRHNSAASVGGPGLRDFKSETYFEGLIDDLRIWDGTALSTKQVFQLYEMYFPDERPNVVLFVADDMNFDSPGFMGGVAPDVTPNIDKLASESMVFTLAHAAESVCQPSRQAMLCGKYPPNYGSVGFFPVADGTPTVVTSLKKAGYVTASFHKNHHMRPFTSFPWEMTEDNTFLRGREFRANGVAKEIGRAPSIMAEATRQTIEASKSTNRPFFLIINSADPHRPFQGTRDENHLRSTYHVELASRVYNGTEVTIPHPLRDIPGVRDDIAKYASSVRRLDDTVGRCLDVIEEAEIMNNTIIIFVSDNGMPMPFGKFETYRDSLNGPLIIRWPGRIVPHVDSSTLVSLTDVAPTIVEIANAEPLPNIDGRSLLPLIYGQTDIEWRDVAVGTRYEDIFYGSHILMYPDPEAFRLELRTQGWVDAPEHPTPGTMKRTMNKRAITDGKYHYIYNAFYPFFHANDIPAVYEYQMDPSYMALMQAALSDQSIQIRMDFYNHRSHEEFYNVKDDPSFEHNLIGKRQWHRKIAKTKQKLLKWMMETNDTLLAEFENFITLGE